MISTSFFTLLNIPFENEEEVEKYGFQSNKNEFYLDNLVKSHISKMGNFLFELGILEYVELDYDNIKQLDDNNIRIVLKFKYLNLKFWTRAIVFLIPILLISGLVYFIL